jgi:hypothetical protein
LPVLAGGTLELDLRSTITCRASFLSGTDLLVTRRGQSWQKRNAGNSQLPNFPLASGFIF